MDLVPLLCTKTLASSSIPFLSIKMASRPGILTEWPWAPLGSFKVFHTYYFHPIYYNTNNHAWFNSFIWFIIYITLYNCWMDAVGDFDTICSKQHILFLVQQFRRKRPKQLPHLPIYDDQNASWPNLDLSFSSSNRQRQKQNRRQRDRVRTSRSRKQLVHINIVT